MTHVRMEVYVQTLATDTVAHVGLVILDRNVKVTEIIILIIIPHIMLLVFTILYLAVYFSYA